MQQHIRTQFSRLQTRPIPKWSTSIWRKKKTKHLVPYLNGESAWQIWQGLRTVAQKADAAEREAKVWSKALRGQSQAEVN